MDHMMLYMGDTPEHRVSHLRCLAVAAAGSAQTPALHREFGERAGGEAPELRRPGHGPHLERVTILQDLQVNGFTDSKIRIVSGSLQCKK